MDWIKNVLVTSGPRILGAIAGWLAAKIAETTGMAVDPTTLIGIALAIYAAVHKAVSAIGVNPGDAATGRIASAEKRAADTGTAVTVAPPHS